MSMKRRNSARVRASLRNVPVMRLVTIDTLRLCTPRVAAGGHALVHGVDHHADPARLEHVRDAVGDLRGELLLHLQPPRVAVDHARELADAHHLAAGEIADVHPSDHRRHVVLAVRLEGDVAQHDHLVVAADFLEGAPEVRGRIDLVSGKPVAVGVDDPVRGIAQAFAVGILARPAQERAHRLLGRAARDPRSRTPHVTVSPGAHATVRLHPRTECSVRGVRGAARAAAADRSRRPAGRAGRAGLAERAAGRSAARSAR